MKLLLPLLLLLALSCQKKDEYNCLQAQSEYGVLCNSLAQDKLKRIEITTQLQGAIGSRLDFLSSQAVAIGKTITEKENAMKTKLRVMKAEGCQTGIPDDCL